LVSASIPPSVSDNSPSLVSVSRLLSGDDLMPESALTNDTVAMESVASDLTGEAADARVWASIRATLSAIRLDSAASPGTYLEDTVVPHGGE
jgi:hypothetical protein